MKTKDDQPRHYRKVKKLTETHAETLQMWAKGFEVREIAALRGCSPRTVESHIEDLLRETGTHNSRELIHEALALQWIKAPQPYAQAGAVLFLSRNEPT